MIARYRKQALLLLSGFIGLALVVAHLPARAADDSYSPPGDGYPEEGASPNDDGVYIPPSQRRNSSRPARGSDRDQEVYSPPPGDQRGQGRGDAYRDQEVYSSPPGDQRGQGRGDAYRPGDEGPYPPPRDGYSDRGGYGEPYAPPRDGGPPLDDRERHRGTYSEGEILDKGHSFFGSISKGLASAVEYTFKQAGRPNGYILGEDAGGALIAGLRYGEGTLYTKDAGIHKVYWQGPSLGYDFGAAGSKTMVLVYNLRDPSDIYHRFGGIEGSAYVIGGVSVQFQKNEDVTLAPIRAGIGLRLGANVGYLKYSRAPTWNPF